ncbi:MAG: YkvA family protein [Spirochaetota bacterium]
MKSKFKKIFFNFRDTVGALLVAIKHPKVSLWSKIIIALALSYALSPVDLVPDFIPFIGYLDDAVILPFLFFIAIKSIPQPVYEECKVQAHSAFKKSLGFIVLGLLLVILLWAFIGFFMYAIVTGIIRLLKA